MCPILTFKLTVGFCITIRQSGEWMIAQPFIDFEFEQRSIRRSLQQLTCNNNFVRTHTHLVDWMADWPNQLAVRQVVDTYLDSQWLKNAPPPQLMISTLLSYFGSIGMALAALQIVIILCHGVSTYNLKQPIRKLCRQWPSLGDYFRDMRSS